jgi:hypothetical protein
MLFVALPDAHAQLGGLVKKKATEKITGKKDTTAAGSAAAKKEKCDFSSIVVTGEVVGRYLKSLDMRDAMLQKLAKEPGPTGEYYAAYLKRQAIEDRKSEYDLRRGPDWAKRQAIRKRMLDGDITASNELSALEASLNPTAVQLPALEWDNQRKAQSRVDSTMKVAGSFSDCDWTTLSEKIPYMTAQLAADPKTKNFGSFGTASEGAAVRLKLPELTRGLHIRYVTPEEQARVTKEEEDEKAADAARAQTRPSTGNKHHDCLIAAQLEYGKAHEAEMKAAQEQNNTTELMRHGMAMNMEAMKKCPQD